MEAVVVSDTNIFIDLISVGLLDEFFHLPLEIHTTDLIVHELKDNMQQSLVQTYITSNQLHIKKYDGKELINLAIMKNRVSKDCNATIQDCSVWLYADENGYSLLTGDAKLRRAAEKSGVDVHGILYIFDKLVEHGVIDYVIAKGKIVMLSQVNNRLPIKEIQKRISAWEAKITERRSR